MLFLVTALGQPWWNNTMGAVGYTFGGYSMTPGPRSLHFYRH